MKKVNKVPVVLKVTPVSVVHVVLVVQLEIQVHQVKLDRLVKSGQKAIKAFLVMVKMHLHLI